MGRSLMSTGGIPKRSVIVAGHRTSISVEGPFWAAIMGAAAARQLSINDLISEIALWAEGQPEAANLSSAVRLWVLARAVQQSLVLAEQKPPQTGALP